MLLGLPCVAKPREVRTAFKPAERQKDPRGKLIPVPKIRFSIKLRHLQYFSRLQVECLNPSKAGIFNTAVEAVH